MPPPDDDLRRQIALFRYGVIADLVHLPRGYRRLGARLKEKAALTYAIPGTQRERIAANTIRGWLTRYRAGGFEALYPKRRAGALEPAHGQAAGIDRRRFACRYAGELWMSDVMHGPKLPLRRTRRKTYPIALLDDATGVVPYAAFTFSETAAAFLGVLRQGLVRRGLPVRLYVDNGSTFRSRLVSDNQYFRVATTIFFGFEPHDGVD